MNPTVSDTSNSRLSGSRTCRTSGSSVTNSASEATAVSFGQPVEQRRLARVGVADERDRRHRLFLTPLAQLRSALPHLIDLALNRLNADANPAAIGFELRFTRSACADAAAEPRQRGARSGQPRQQVFELRELDLPLALARPGATREDVEDQLRPIDDLAFEPLLELPELRGGQFVVEDHDVDVRFGACRGERADLAGADEGRRIRLGPFLQHAQNDAGARRFRETRELVERMIRVAAARRSDQADKSCSLDCGDMDRILQVSGIRFQA